MATDKTAVRAARTEQPIRFRAAKADAHLSSMQATLEKTFGLPAGSVRLVYPSGRKARSDSTVGTFRDHWEQRG